jgi:hypothetical protein
MRLVLLSLAASVAAATPAFANEARVEARGGVFWTEGYDHATAGVAGGYDFDLGRNAFAGGEVSADKILDSGTKVAFGFTGRLGAKVETSGKLFAAGGYTTEPFDGTADSWHLGAGYEHGFGKVYGKIEYRHFFTNNGFNDADTVLAGIGMNF